MCSPLQDHGDKVEFALVDVFGAGPLTGNPLAVVDLTTAEVDEPPQEWMRAVAREMNQAETTFVLSATREGAHRRLRSFTAGGIEVFGAGHNALGAWWWLLHTGRVARPDNGVIVQEIGSRLLEVLVGGEGQLTMRQERPRFGALAAATDVATAVGLSPRDLDPAVPPRVVGTGADHLIVGVATPAALAAAAVDKQALVSVAEAVEAQGVYLAVVGPGRPISVVTTRFFNPGTGLDEDPATGSAAGPLAAYLADLQLLETTGMLTVHQGESMQRPSTITARIQAETVVTVGGSASLSAQGWLSAASAQPLLG